MHRRRLAIVAAAGTVLATAAVVTAGPASAAAGCQVKYTISSQWPGGFGATVDVTNLGDPINGWTLAFSYSAGQTVTQLWNGSVTQSGSTVTVHNAAWNNAIATNGTASFGFNGSWTGSNPAPSSFTLNGVTCTGAVSTTPPTTTPTGTPTTAPTTTTPTTPPTTTPTTPPTTAPTTPPSGAPVKIMALGDSITGSPGCWRALLWQMLP